MRENNLFQDYGEVRHPERCRHVLVKFEKTMEYNGGKKVAKHRCNGNKHTVRDPNGMARIKLVPNTSSVNFNDRLVEFDHVLHEHVIFGVIE